MLSMKLYVPIFALTQARSVPRRPRGARPVFSFPETNIDLVHHRS